MKKIISLFVTAMIFTGIYFAVTALLGPKCDHCEDKIYGTRYHLEGHSEDFCSEACARTWEFRKKYNYPD